MGTWTPSVSAASRAGTREKRNAAARRFLLSVFTVFPAIVASAAPPGLAGTAPSGGIMSSAVGFGQTDRPAKRGRRTGRGLVAERNPCPYQHLLNTSECRHAV